jgi:hypothetical protein
MQKKPSWKIMLKYQKIAALTLCLPFVFLESAAELFTGKARKKVKVDAYCLYARV